MIWYNLKKCIKYSLEIYIIMFKINSIFKLNKFIYIILFIFVYIYLVNITESFHFYIIVIINKNEKEINKDRVNN
jgi:hypothetical protein